MKGYKMLKTLKKMLSYLSPYKTQFLIGQLAMLVGTAAGLAFPWAVRGIFGSLFEAEANQNLTLAIGIWPAPVVGWAQSGLIALGF